jgi:hypothetical protein
MYVFLNINTGMFDKKKKPNGGHLHMPATLSSASISMAITTLSEVVDISYGLHGLETWSLIRSPEIFVYTLVDE